MTYIRGKARRADSEGALTGPISDLGLYANKLQQPPLLKYLFIKTMVQIHNYEAKSCVVK